MTNGPWPRSLTLLILGLALACFGVCAFQVMHVGLLADDFYAGQAVSWHESAHPNVLDRIVTTFTRKWVNTLPFWHRPILALSAQADYAMFGTDGRLQHIPSLVLWLLVAAAAALLARRALASPLPATPVVVGAIALLHPSAVEALAWLAARDDLFFALFGLLTLRARLRSPDSAVAPIPWLVLALLSKETAVVLVPLLNLATFLVPRETPARVRLFRELVPWVVLGAWFLFRQQVLGTGQTSYGPTQYFGNFDFGTFAANVWQSFGQLVAPANATAMKAAGLPTGAIRAVFVVASLVLLGAGFVLARLPGDLRRGLFLLACVAAPIVFLSPVFVVNVELNGGRGLAFPSACWAVLLGLAVDRAVRRPTLRFVAIPALLALLAASMVSFVAALPPYVHATLAAEAAVRSLDPVPPGDAVVLLGTYDPAAPGNGMREDLIRQAGAYVISAGIHPAMGPPFRGAPPVQVSIPESDAAVLSVEAGGTRPWLAVLPPNTVGNPVFRILASGRAEGPPVEIEPKHRATIDARQPLVFRLRPTAAAMASLATLSLTSGDAHGLEARAAITAEQMPALRTPDGWITVPTKRFTPPFDSAMLRAANVRVFIWWAEGRDAAGNVVFRTPWSAVTVAP